MNRTYIILIIVFSFLISRVSAQDITGIWAGAISAHGMQMHVVFHVNKEGYNQFSATMDSPDQGVKGILIDSTLFKNDSLTFILKKISGKYLGKFDKDSNAFIGVWQQGPSKFSLTLKKSDVAPTINRPQTPKPPYPYKEEEVSYENKTANITIGGTLTLPQGNGKYPAVIMITGSGKQDRDETIFAHKPFMVIADYLTRNGIAVLRVDDRGMGKSTGDFSKSTGEDFASDVRAGIEYLKSRNEIDKTKIGLIGHSEGGIIAPMIASQSNNVAFIVLMAGPGANLFDVIKMQQALLLKMNGASEEEIRMDTIRDSEIQKIIINAKNDVEAKEKITTLLLKDSIEGEEANGSINFYVNPWMKYYATYSPVDALKKVKCPVLAINGGNDMQVSPKQNIPVIESALKAGGNKNYKTIEIPGLNHLFQHSETGSPYEYAKIEETISPEVLKTMNDWILEITGKK